MHTHGYHNHCKHDLSYCDKCDVVYCEECGREWGTKKYSYTYTFDPYIWTYRGIPYTVTWGDSGYTLTTSNGTAVRSNDVISAFYSSSQQSFATANVNQTTHTHNK